MRKCDGQFAPKWGLEAGREREREKEGERKRERDVEQHTRAPTHTHVHTHVHKHAHLCDFKEVATRAWVRVGLRLFIIIKVLNLNLVVKDGHAFTTNKKQNKTDNKKESKAKQSKTTCLFGLQKMMKKNRQPLLLACLEHVDFPV